MSRHPFKIVEPVASQRGRLHVEPDRDAPAAERVRRMVDAAEVFLFMKGVPAQPKCGFSANTVAILESYGVPFATFDVLSDEAVRAAAKEVADWPTFPQVWLKGEFIGGNDVLMELHACGELERLLREVAR